MCFRDSSAISETLYLVSRLLFLSFRQRLFFPNQQASLCLDLYHWLNNPKATTQHDAAWDRRLEMEDYDWKQLRAAGSFGTQNLNTYLLSTSNGFLRNSFSKLIYILNVKKKLSSEKITEACGERVLQVLQLQASHHKHALCYPVK